MQAPFGTWRSPLTAELVAATGRRVGELAIDGGDVYWGESRPAEGGRITIMRRSMDGAISELLPAPFNARTRVHEYGGGAMVVAGGTVWFSNFADNRLYRLARGAGTPEPVTAEGPWRYADFALDRVRNRLVCVREDHAAGGAEPRNEIVAVDLASGIVEVLVAGADFYAFPRPSPDGARLGWIEWRHPDMPWDATLAYVADIAADGRPRVPHVIAGGAAEAVYCPQWSPAGVLHLVSDRTGWWNLYRVRGHKLQPRWASAEEFGVPLWNLGSATYGFDGEDLIAIHGRPGGWRLSRLAARGRARRHYRLPYTELGGIRVSGGRAVMVAAAPGRSAALIEVALDTGAHRVLHQPSDLALDDALVSEPEAISFPTEAGPAHAFFYAPRNPGFTAPPGERPPLIVMSHGGPTGSTSTAFSPGIQFWTTRGFAVLDVNYGGSTGYGRAYRERLAGRWGVLDVADCIAGARHLVARGDVDGQRLLIRGGSAGGYTTLCALTFHDVFRAGASHYGIGDLEALASHTHKFESRYLDKLVGPWPAARETYVERSPIHHVDRLSCGAIFFQGLDDKVVPPGQAEAMVAALRAKGLPVAYVPFAGEGHGFRKGENIRRALEAELYFYGRVLGFTPADSIEPVTIENLAP
jgi:dipeptidyl aminopeptidase/acylaminoacyl peptidase